MFKFLLAALLAASAQALPGVSVDAVLDEIRSAPIGWPESKASAVKGTATLSAGGDREHYIAHKDGHKHFSGSMSLAQATADGWYKRNDPTPETPMLDHENEEPWTVDELQKVLGPFFEGKKPIEDGFALPMM